MESENEIRERDEGNGRGPVLESVARCGGSLTGPADARFASEFARYENGDVPMELVTIGKLLIVAIAIAVAESSCEDYVTILVLDMADKDPRSSVPAVASP